MKMQRQSGAALFVSLIVLALLMILGTASISSGVIGLRIASNTNQIIDAAQSSDSGISATMSLVGTANDPFTGTSNSNPFSALSSTENPLQNISNVNVSSALLLQEGACTRAESASSSSKVACEYYELNSRYAPPNLGVASSTTLGVRREIIAN